MKGNWHVHVCLSDDKLLRVSPWWQIGLCPPGGNTGTAILVPHNFSQVTSTISMIRWRYIWSTVTQSSNGLQGIEKAFIRFHSSVPNTITSLVTLSKTGHAALVDITGTTKLIPFHSVKSLQLIWRSGTRRFHLRVPDRQMSRSDLTKMGRVTSTLTITMTPKVTCHYSFMVSVLLENPAMM